MNHLARTLSQSSKNRKRNEKAIQEQKAHPKTGRVQYGGHVFLFCNQSRNRLKILFWDGNGLWVCAKRLERGRFNWPQEETQGDRVRLTQEELTLLLGGIDLERTRAKNWYRYEEKNLEKN